MWIHILWWLHCSVVLPIRGNASAFTSDMRCTAVPTVVRHLQQGPPLIESVTNLFKARACTLAKHFTGQVKAQKHKQSPYLLVSLCFVLFHVVLHIRYTGALCSCTRRNQFHLLCGLLKEPDSSGCASEGNLLTLCTVGELHCTIHAETQSLCSAIRSLQHFTMLYGVRCGLSSVSKGCQPYAPQRPCAQYIIFCICPNDCLKPLVYSEGR